ncbi:hypothetical protein A2U01_0101869, partial [Trifolium medium]|nr:hypothetical protein [Trifolium medium]
GSCAARKSVILWFIVLLVAAPRAGLSCAARRLRGQG